MYKKALGGLMIFHVLLLLVLAGTAVKKNQEDTEQEILQTTLDEVYVANEERKTVGIARTASSGQRIVEYDAVEKPEEPLYSLTEEDRDALLRIVEAEAGSEDEEGKLLVANVVLNRVKDQHFPDTVKDVVTQRENGITQFSPVSNGRFYRVTVSEETKDAVERALKGEDISQGALYFAARKYADSERMKWFDDHLFFLFEYGGHEFFTSY